VFRTLGFEGGSKLKTKKNKTSIGWGQPKTTKAGTMKKGGVKRKGTLGGGTDCSLKRQTPEGGVGKGKWGNSMFNNEK